MAATNDHITPSLPLDELLQRLELAGFVFSPADRLRAWQVLSGPGKRVLHEPARLKYLLAPVLVRGEAEQERFYAVFDRYYAEITTQPTVPPPAFRVRWWHYALGVGLLTLLVWGLLRSTAPPPAAVLAPAIEGPTYGTIGDTIHFLNTTPRPPDSSRFSFRWEWEDVLTRERKLLDSINRHLTVVVPTPADSAYRKLLVLRVTDKKTARSAEMAHPFAIYCPAAPQVTGILGIPVDGSAPPVTFEVVPQGEVGPWAYDWTFGDGQTAQGRTYEHTFTDPGRYTIELTVTDTTQAGFCAITLREEINIGRVNAFVPPLTYARDQPNPSARFGWGYWTFLILIGLIPLFYWLRWIGRTPPPVPEPSAGSRAARFQVSDKAPYFIPFRAQEPLLNTQGAEFRLAEAMRQRQTGWRRGIDVPATLTATIEQGGYPAVRFAYSTQPTEYLILIDEQGEFSHLGRLFQHLAQLLRGQDVNAEIYYFRRHFDRYWNNYTPEGLSLDLLYRRYPGHRLLMLADAHDLLDPHVPGRPGLRPMYTANLRQWSDRLLLTPVPPVSWSYREKVLSDLFAVYPADLPGLAAAALYLEQDTDPPSDDFTVWQSLQIAQRTDSDTEYRSWKRLREHRDYLAPYPGLWTWFLALAVYPTPTWEITIAIGHALQRDGVVLDHDNLLRLARIPTLQQGRFPNRLRQEMLQQLDPAVAEKARRAVRAELAAVRAETKEGHASLELETAIAVQDFALQPEAEQERTTIRYLLDQGMLTPAQVAELDQVAQQAAAATEPMTKSNIATSTPPRVGIEDYLADAPVVEEDPTPQIGWFDAAFWRAVAWSVAFMALLLASWYLNGSDTLYQLTYGERVAATAGEETPLRRNMLLRETWQVDSAVIYNNYGVDLAETTPDRLITVPFERAQAARFTAYPLAKANWQTAYYNQAARMYNRHLQTGTLASAVPDTIYEYLKRAGEGDTLFAEVVHLDGLFAYYRSDRATAQARYDALQARNFFDTLTIFPNLETLMGMEETRLQPPVVNEIGDNISEVSINFFVNPTVDSGLTLVAYLLPDSLGQSGPLPDTVRFATQTGAQTLDFRFEPPPGDAGTSTALRVDLQRPDGTVVQSRTVPLVKEWMLLPATLNNFFISGRVIDARTRKSIPQALIRIESVKLPLLGSKSTQGYSDARGAFRVGIPLNAAVPVFKVSVGHKGYTTYKVEVNRAKMQRMQGINISLQPIAPASAIDVIKDVIERGKETIEPTKPASRQNTYQQRFSGRIVSQDSRLPVGQAKVYLAHNNPPRSVAANANGMVEFTLPEIGFDQPLNYLVYAPGYLPHTYQWRELALETPNYLSLSSAIRWSPLLSALRRTPNPTLCVRCYDTSGQHEDYTIRSVRDQTADTDNLMSLINNRKRLVNCEVMDIEQQVRAFYYLPLSDEVCVTCLAENGKSGWEVADTFCEDSVGALQQNVDGLILRLARQGRAGVCFVQGQ